MNRKLGCCKGDFSMSHDYCPWQVVCMDRRCYLNVIFKELIVGRIPRRIRVNSKIFEARESPPQMLGIN